MPYTAIAYSPVQSFIEKSRKLRDLFGASAILSYLSQEVVKAAQQLPQLTVISPGTVTVGAGMTNRILIKGEFSQELAETTIKSAWKAILKECKNWIENKLPNEQYFWDNEWEKWGAHTWEISWGEGDTIAQAMKNLETLKLSRNWKGINWIGESSSLSGTDAIAWPELGRPKDLRKHDWKAEKTSIKAFYSRLACVLEGKNANEEATGAFLDTTERLNIPELVKRMVTHPDISGKFQEMYRLEETFTDIVRKPEPGKHSGQWTGWFIGDGDKVGEKLVELAKAPDGDEAITQFSTKMRAWGAEFKESFKLGRIIYAGGDDFLGVIYSKDVRTPKTALEAYQWLKETLKAKWKEHEQDVNLSVGFVWAAPSVPQRDVLQHCREAETIAKNKGRDRVTLRVVFNNGQYVQWTCPWDKLDILESYQDRERESNWSHVYADLAHLKARRAIDLTVDENKIDASLALALLNLYFNNCANEVSSSRKTIVGDTSDKSLVQWINDLILVGWQLCSDT